MNKPSSHNNPEQQDDVDLTENCKNQCLHYLFGELGSEQLTCFEKRLGKSDPLSDELQRQAEMLVALSAISHLPGVSRRHIISATSQNANCPSQKSRSQKLPLRGLGIAVAAFIAVFVFQTSWSSTTPPQESESPNNDYFAGQAIDHDSNMLTVSESALIARAWAAAQVDSEDTTSTPYASLGGTYVQSIDSSNDELKLDIEATENTSDDSFS